jgi:hypothetical protein
MYEVSQAWRVAIQRRTGPTALILTRQAVPVIDRQLFDSAEGLHQGAYVLGDLGDKKPELILMASGSEVSLDGSITLFFNQPMDRESAEAAFFGLPGTITWIDDSTLIFTPEAPLEPATQVDLTFDTSLKAANGLPALQPISLPTRRWLCN